MLLYHCVRIQFLDPLRCELDGTGLVRLTTACCYRFLFYVLWLLGMRIWREIHLQRWWWRFRVWIWEVLNFCRFRFWDIR